MSQDAGVTGNNELGATKQALIASLVQRELAASAILPGTITDVSMFAVPGAKSITFPKSGSLVASNRASGTQGAPQALTFTGDTMTLDQNAYVAWLIDSGDAIQSSVAVQQEYVKRAASAHARYLDQQILATLVAAAVPAASVGDISDVIIRNMRAALLTKNALIGNISLVVSVAQEDVMLGIDRFVRADQYGSSNIPGGVIGKLYGVPVIVHNALPTGVNAVMYEKGGAAYGFQKGPAYDEQKAIGYGVGSVLCACDQLFGTKGLQLGQESVASGKSPLITVLTAA